MVDIVKSRLQSVRLGEAQVYKNIALVPLIAPADGAFPYRTLGEALAAQELTISEVSSAGSVPELAVMNRGRQAVLLVDGEELAGAKQNRVLNTSILLKEASETRIPVSCTEQGRWAYASKSFQESGNVMAFKARSLKTRSVQHSLESCGTPTSDQSEVWAGIAALQVKACAPSPTSAMSDVFKARDDDLRACEEVFGPVPGQVGLVALIGGQPAGADLVSLGAAYARLHSKLVRSYTLEALLDHRLAAASPGDPGARAREFLDQFGAAEERQFPSVGYGTDHRFKGKGLAGTALVHQEEVIHAAFFRLDGPEPGDDLAPFRARRRYRTE